MQKTKKEKVLKQPKMPIAFTSKTMATEVPPCKLPLLEVPLRCKNDLPKNINTALIHSFTSTLNTFFIVLGLAYKTFTRFNFRLHIKNSLQS